MNELLQLGQNITLSEMIVALTATSFVVQIIINSFNKLAKLVISKYKHEQSDEKISVTVEELSAQLTKSNISTEKKIDDLSKSVTKLSQEFTCNLKSVHETIENNLQESKAYRRADLHDKLIKMHDEYTHREYISHVELANFNLMLEQYYQADGNGLVRSKYAPEVLALEVKDD